MYTRRGTTVVTQVAALIYRQCLMMMFMRQQTWVYSVLLIKITLGIWFTFNSLIRAFWSFHIMLCRTYTSICSHICSIRSNTGFVNYKRFILVTKEKWRMSFLVLSILKVRTKLVWFKLFRFNLDSFCFLQHLISLFIFDLQVWQVNELLVILFGCYSLCFLLINA